MKNRIICGRPLSAREFAWGLVALIVLPIALGTLILHPLLAAVALGAFILASGRAGFFRRLQQEFRRFLDYRLYHSLGR